MITQSFVRRSLVLFLFSLIASTQFAYATVVPEPCRRYSYMDTFAADTNTLPSGVTVREVVLPGGIFKSYFLDNANSKPLVMKYGAHHWIKLVDSKTYLKFNETYLKLEKSGTADYWLTSTDTSRISHSDLRQFQDNYDKVRSRSSSDTKPAPIAPVHFAIEAQYDGQPITIAATLSYVLLEHTCANGKMVDTRVAPTGSSWTVVSPVPPIPNPAPKNCPTLSHNLNRGSRGNDVSMLQSYLISQGLLASGSATGYFGPLTERAVQGWQSSHGIVSSGTPPTTGYGSVGPRTRVALAKCQL